VGKSTYNVGMKRTVIIVLLACSLAGCVEREWTIQSSPAGAVVYVSSVEVGRTPVTIDFTWYGDYEVVLRKEGYETLKTSVKLDPPLYELPGVDFFSAIAPWTYHDRRESLHILQRRRPPSKAQLKTRAEELRRDNKIGDN